MKAKLLGTVLSLGLLSIFANEICACLPPCSTPGEPALLSPSNHATCQNVAGVVLSWSNVGAHRYDVYMDTSQTPTIYIGSTTGTSLNSGSLSQNTKYYWRVKAVNYIGCTGPKQRWSDTWDFTTEGALHVNKNTTCTTGCDGSTWELAFKYLQDALDVALPCHQIWVAAGTYYPDEDKDGDHTNDDRAETFQLPENVELYGGFAGGETSLDERDWAAHNTILSGDLAGDDESGGDNSENSYHVVIGADDAILDGFTITGSNANGSSPDNVGGGMYNYQASPTVANCKFENNIAMHGGGMYIMFSSARVLNCVFSDNETSYGGGIYAWYSPQAVVSNCVFSGNEATYGSGMSIRSSLTVSNCIFVNNYHSAGAMYTKGACYPTVTNCVFSGNYSDSKAGAMFNLSAYPIVTNCIFWGNDAAYEGDEIYNLTPDGNKPTFSYCDIEGGLNGSKCGGYDSNDGGGSIDADPLFVNAGDSDGPDGIFGTIDDGLRLPVGSPCIDTGDPNTDSNDVGTVDISNDNRFMDGDHDGNNVIDMGAYELPRIWYIDDDIQDGNGFSWATAYDDLQDALYDANDGDEIWVAMGTYKPTDGNDPMVSFGLVEDVGVYGGFLGLEVDRCQRDWAKNKTILSGDINEPNDANDNSFHVVTGSGVGQTAVLDGFIITGGNANGSSSYDRGGGMYNNSGSPTVVNCTFRDNLAGTYAAGMYNYNCSSTITNCFFANNSSTQHTGGMWNYNSNPTLTNCVFSGNSASDGGGMNNYNSDPTLINCTFTGNSATGNGGGLYNETGSDPAITNCIFWDNSDSGGKDESAQIYGGTPTVNYSCIQGWSGGGNGNINNDPCFVEMDTPAGWDDVFGTLDDGLRLTADSPCIDAADGNFAPWTDILDLERVDINDVNNTGVGDPNYADMGAYEADGSDRDGDGLWDYYEIYVSGTDPDNSDTDNDGLSDGTELNNYGTDPLSADTDDDKLSDKDEVCYDGDCDSYDPCTPGTWGSDLNADSNDTDGDGMPDGWEVFYGFNPLADDAGGDSDGDNLLNVDEYNAETNPNNEDTDGDGMKDNWEVLYDVLDPLDANDVYENPDGDDCNNILEIDFGMDPGIADDPPAYVKIVPSFSYPTLKDAITACTDGNTVVVKPGIYTEEPQGGGFPPTFLVDENIELRSINPHDPQIVARTIIKGWNENYDVIELDDSNIDINGLTITGGNNGIYYHGSSYLSPEITHCVISENRLCGIYVWTYGEGVTATIKNCTFSDNGEGGIYVYGKTNYASSNPGEATVENCIFSHNEATLEGGGGIYIEAEYNHWPDGDPGKIKISNCIFNHNKAPGNGGGVYIDADSECDAAREVTVENCVFSRNEAVNGGGVYSEVESYYNNSLLMLTNCTFNGNSANKGGAIYNNDTEDFQAYNCILWGNEATQGSEVANIDTTAFFGNCDIKGGLNGFYNYNSSVTGAGNIDDPPLFIYPEDSAGLDNICYTDDDGLRLQPSSPCVDAADDSKAPITDMFGQERNVVIPYSTGTSVADIGAHEVSLIIWHVKDTPAGAQNGSSWNDAMYLQDALAEVRQYGGEIWVATGEHKPSQGTVISDPTERTNSFELIDGVGLYGGFSGDEVLRVERNWTLNKTELNGDIDAGENDSYHVVSSIHNNATAIIDGFTITGGNANGGSENNYGGGIYCFEASPTVSNCVITGNKAIVGGGVGVLNEGPFSSSAEFTNCTFSENEADQGGGMANCYESSPRVTSCVFTGNYQADQGGGMFNTTYSSPTVTNCVFTDNEAEQGGGIANVGNCSPAITNCVFVDNEATNATGTDGGAMYNENSRPVLINCTFAGNTALVTGGIYNNADLLSGSSAINCILWSNTGSSQEVGGPGQMTFSYCDVNGCGGSENWNSSFGIDGSGNIDVDPYFMDANNPAGQDGIYRTDDDGLRLCVFDPRDGGFQAVFEGSCLDSADHTVAPEKDITGRVRMDVPYIPNNGSSSIRFIDMGAYESPAVWYVNINNDNRGQGWSWNSAVGNLEDAIERAGAGSEIWVAGGEYIPTDSQRLSTFLIDKAIAIYGGFAGTEYNRYERNWKKNISILSGNIGDDGEYEDNCYHVVTIDCNDAVLDGFTVADGYACDWHEPNERGAGIYVDNSSPTIANCIIRDNYAFYYGSGMYVGGGSPTVTDCIFWNNREQKDSYPGYADKGGGMCNENASPIVTNCIFSRNPAGDGGGIYNTKSSPVIINCIFSDNAAGGKGGGICNEKGTTAIVTNCIFIANKAGGYGGGVYQRDDNDRYSSLQLSDCTFAWNRADRDDRGSGLYLYHDIDHAPTYRETVTNCIFWNNRDDSTTYQIKSTVSASLPASESPLIRYCDVEGGTSGISGTYQNGGNIIDDNPDFVAKPEFYDETVAGGYFDAFAVTDASIYNFGDIIQYGTDANAKSVIYVDYNYNIVAFDPPLEEPTEQLIEIKNWGKYAITGYDSWDDDNSQIKDKIARLTVTTASATSSQCIDTGLDTDLPADTTDLDGDGHTIERIPYDIMGVPRLQDIWQDVNPNSVDMGAFESGGLVANSPQTQPVPEDTEVDFQLDIEPDPKGGSLTYDVIIKPKHGTWSHSLTSGIHVKYKPDPNGEENDRFYYKAYDGNNYSEIAQVNINLTREDDPPVAVDDEAWINPGQTQITIDVNDNDYDVDPGQTLDVISVTDPPSGSTTLNADDTITYEPDDPGAIPEQDQFNYTIQDSGGTPLSDTAQVTVRLNHEPVVNDDTAQTEPNIIAVVDALANDTDSDGHSLTIVDLVEPVEGDARIYNHPEFGEVLIYMPNDVSPPNYTFTYKVEDEFDLKSSSAATVTVTVNDTATIADYDRDAISDEDENDFFGTNPYDPDTDGDGITDGDEVMQGSDPTNPYSGDYYADPLPYTTCFGSTQGTQGYSVNEPLDHQRGWKLEDGTCDIAFKPDLCFERDIFGDPAYYFGGFVARLGANSAISKEFDDKGDDDNNSNIIRVKLYPVDGARVKVISGDTVIAGAKFVDVSGTKTIYYWDVSGNDWQDSGTNWNEWNPPEVPEYEENNHSYAMMLKFKFSFSTSKYELFWDETMNDVEDPVQVGGDGQQYDLPVGVDAISHVKLESEATEFEARALYINEIDTTALSITNLCYCPEINQSRVPVKGYCRSPDFSLYFLSWESSDGGPWHNFDESDRPVNGDILGYWDTGVLQNGLYDVALSPLLDLYLEVGSGDEVMYYVRAYSSYTEVEEIAVAGHLKTNTFHYVEEPDISVPWPGQFPFELKRIYDGKRSRHKWPLYPGWTHNNQIILVEDARYFEPFEEGGLFGGFAAHDNSLLAFGYIWVQYEDGSTHLFRHTTGSIPLEGEDSIYTPYPDNGSGDYIERVSVDDGLTEISTVDYTLHRSDGTTITFYQIILGVGELPISDLSHGNLLRNGSLFKFTTAVQTKSDRFGNTLSFQWNEDEEIPAITKISYTPQVGTTTSIDLELQLLLNPIAYGHNLVYTKAELMVNDVVKREVTYDHWYTLSGGFRPQAIDVITLGLEGDETGTLGATPVAKKFTRYYYGDPFTNSYSDNLLYIAEHDNMSDLLLFTTLLDYDDQGRVSLRVDLVDAYNYLPTWYSYDYFDPYSGSSDGQWLCTTVSTPYKATYSIQNEDGELVSQFTEPFDGTPAKQVFYEYDSSGPPFRPTQTYEYWADYDCDIEEFVEVGREIVNSYDTRYLDENFGSGNPSIYVWDLNSQCVYDLGDDLDDDSDDSLVAYNEKDYHDYAHYKVDTNSLSYQRLNPAGPNEHPVQTKYVYGLHDGTTSGTASENKYLIQEIVLIDDMGTQSPSDDVLGTTYYEYTHAMPGGAYALTKRTDPFGSVTLYEYDPNHHKKWVRVGPAGSEEPVERYHYDGIGQMLLKADTYGLVTLYDYDGFGNVYKVRTYHDPYALDEAISFIPPDKEDPPKTDYKDMVPRSTTIYTYDEHCRRDFEKTFSQEKGPSQVGVKRTIYSATTANDKPKIIIFDEDDDPATDDSFMVYAYDGRGLKIWEYKYDAITDLWWYKDYFYDSMDRLFWTIWWDYKDATILKLLAHDYHGSGKKGYEDVWGPDAQGLWQLQRRTDYKYDVLGRLTDEVVTYNYDDAGLPERVTTSYAYDDVGNRTSVKDPKDNITFFDYDNANRKIREYFAIEYDGVSLETTKANAVSEKEIGYYDNNLLKSMKDYDYQESGHGVLAYKELDYDKRGRVKQVDEFLQDPGLPNPDKATATYIYQDAGKDNLDFGDYANVTITADFGGENNLTKIAYNERGQVIKTIYPSNQEQEFVYNGDGTLYQKSVFDGGGAKKWIEYNYNEFFQLEQVTYPDTPMQGTVTYEYDGFGRLKRFNDGRIDADKIGGTGSYANKIVYEYDPLDRIIGVTNQDGYHTKYQYRGDGQKQTITVTEPNSPESIIYDVAHKYDIAGRLTAVIEPLLPYGYQTIAGFGYDNDCGCSCKYRQSTYSLNGTDSGGVSVDYTYNPDNVLISFGTTGGPTFSFDATATGDIDGLGRLKAANEILTKTDNSTVNHSYTCTYDMRSELTNATITNIGSGDWTGVYHYKKNGDMDYRIIEGSQTNFTYVGNLMDTAAGGGDDFDLDWDLNGNMILDDLTVGDDTTLVHSWDNKLRSATCGTKSISLKYDRFGNRIFKDSTETGARKYIVDIVGSLPTILLELDTTNNIKKTYIYAKSEIIAKHEGDHTAIRYFYLHDGLGSIRQIMDTAGKVVKLYTYNPFGETLETDGTLDNVFTFTGQYYDTEIDEYYLRARQYDPHIGRFTSRDPVSGKLKEPLTLHKYLYSINDPVNKIDPMGRNYMGALKRAQRIVNAEIVRNKLFYEVLSTDMDLLDMAVTLAIVSNEVARYIEEKPEDDIGYADSPLAFAGLRVTRGECRDGRTQAEHKCHWRMWSRGGAEASMYVLRGALWAFTGEVAKATGSHLVKSPWSTPTSRAIGWTLVVGGYGIQLAGFHDVAMAGKIVHNTWKANEMFCDCDRVLNPARFRKKFRE